MTRDLILPRPRIAVMVGTLFLAVTSAHAATIEVPGDHTTIEAALDAANPGDTILITNSATYNVEDLTVNKPINLAASLGQSPTILGIFRVGAGGAGSRIGDLNGGRITFDGGNINDSTFRFVFTETETWFENLLITGSTSSLVMWGSGNAAEPVDVTLNFTEVIVNAAGNLRGWRPHNATGNGSVHNFTRCTFTGASRQGVWFNAAGGGGGTYNFHQCDFSGNERAGLYIEAAAADREVTINVTESFLSGGTGVPTPFRVFGSGAAGVSPITVNFEKSALKAFGGNSSAVAFQIFGGGTNDNMEVHFKDCDLLSSGSSPVLNYIEAASEDVIVTLLDSNLIAADEEAIGIRNDNFFLQEPILATNCNIVAGTPASEEPGFELVTIVDPIDPPIEPNYIDLDNRVFCYTDVDLLVASSTGGSVGSNFDFSIYESCDDVTVPPGDLGDVNGDGAINVADVTELAILVAAGTPPGNEVGDVNNDGTVDELDVQALAEMIAND